jgi:hypothetical protein
VLDLVIRPRLPLSAEGRDSAGVNHGVIDWAVRETNIIEIDL